MSQAELDRRLQDYLDDRLDDRERAELEALIRDDPAAAAGLESLRELRLALREDSGGADALSPGFYTQAKSRFAQSQRKTTERGFRLFSWETAGLAAAAVITLALFMPDILERPGETSIESRFETPQQVEAVATEDNDVADDLAAVETGEPAADEETPGPAGIGKRDVAEKFMEIDAPVEEEKVTGRVDRVEAAPARPTLSAPPPAPAATRRREARQKAAAADAGLGEQQFAGAAMKKESSRSFQDRELFAVGLPEGTVERNTMRIVEERTEWERLLLGAAGEEIRSLGDYAPSRRLVLIGADADRIDCTSLTVGLAGDVYRISVGRARTGDRFRGCGLTLPRDGREVVVE